MSLRPTGDWIQIQMDEETEDICGGLLIKPEIAHEHVLRTAVVTKMGPGKWNKKGTMRIPFDEDLKVGVGIVFVKFHAEYNTAKDMRQVMGDDRMAQIKETAVLLVYDRDDPVEFSQ